MEFGMRRFLVWVDRFSEAKVQRALYDIKVLRILIPDILLSCVVEKQDANQGGWSLLVVYCGAPQTLNMPHVIWTWLLLKSIKPSILHFIFTSSISTYVYSIMAMYYLGYGLLRSAS